MAVFLWRRHIIDSPLCDYCGKENQSDVHILRDCKVIYWMWKAILPLDCCDTFFVQNDFTAWVEQSLTTGTVGTHWPKHWADIFRQGIQLA